MVLSIKFTKPMHSTPNTRDTYGKVTKDIK